MYSKIDALNFQGLQTGRLFKSTEYPLLHDLDSLDVLKPFFHTFDSAPNIVILVVEGLNDDFIYNYKGAKLMPFMSELKDKSLYWNRCFTLGERSFAAIPSILGSLIVINLSTSSNLKESIFAPFKNASTAPG